VTAKTTADATPHAKASAPLSTSGHADGLNEGASTAGVVESGAGAGAGGGAGARGAADEGVRRRYERSNSSAPAAAKTNPSGSPKTSQRVIWPAKPPAMAPATQSCVSNAESAPP